MGVKAHAVFLGPAVAVGLDLAYLSFLPEGGGGRGPAAAGPRPPSLSILFPQKLSPVPGFKDQPDAKRSHI